MESSNVTNKRPNVAGLISGNLKRHLRAKHQTYANHLFGYELMANVDVDCNVCDNHRDALTREMERDYV